MGLKGSGVKLAALSVLFSVIAAAVGMLAIMAVAYLHALRGLVLPQWIYGLILVLAYFGTRQFLNFVRARLFTGVDE
jgi:ABC-type transport system involved in cytochrome bd biosynthesis fused ATPase/permease subunit